MSAQEVPKIPHEQPCRSQVTVYDNGKQHSGDPTALPLGSREAIQIDVGTPVPPKSVDWSRSQL